MKQVFLIAALFAILTCPAIGQEMPPKPTFPLGLWYEGGVGNARDNVLPSDPAKAAEVYEKNFADIAAHNINIVVIPNSPPNHHKLILDTAQKHGLYVILELGLDGGPFGHMIRGDKPMDDKLIQETLEKVLGPIKDHPALLRVQLLDEPPGGKSFDRFGKIAAEVRKFSPNTEPFCCLTGVSDGAAYLKASKSDVVCFDAYPIAANVKEGDAKPIEDFVVTNQRFVEWAEANLAQSWAAIQCHAITGALRYPTPAEMRCMTYVSLATGNRGVFWFLYQTEHVGQAEMGGLVDRKFQPRPLWPEVGKLAEELKPLTTVLANLHQPMEVKQDDALLLTRKLTDGRGAEYLFAVNLDTTQTRKVKIAYAPPQDHAMGAFVAQFPDKKIPIAKTARRAGDVSDPMGWEVELPAGGGALFLLGSH